MSWLNHILGKDWTIAPAGGLTGDAYIATSKDRRLFLKRNSSTFLAVLSVEGIVPKLIWTKRLENGDVITAQEWVDGRELHKEEMQQQHVAELLHKIHHSSELLHMLMRLGKKPMSLDDNVQMAEAKLRYYGLYEKKIVRQTLHYLRKFYPTTVGHHQVVCHRDLNHNNLILTKEGQLYLVDWENAAIADPVMDFGMVLKWYIPKHKWAAWLEKYGMTLDAQLLKRMYWYLILDTLHYLIWHYERKDTHKVTAKLRDLTELGEDIQAMFRV
ncbi:MAG TPA: phosphotransferase family protein [Bacillota bacterium]|nr:phosphotransferase family protein [Bacillota bacterium]